MNNAPHTATRPLNGELLYQFDGQFSDIVPIGPVADGFRILRSGRVPGCPGHVPRRPPADIP